MLEGKVKTINIRKDTKHGITVTYMLEGRVNHFTIRIDTKHRITVTHVRRKSESNHHPHR